jgi:perosamine synthetase
MILEGIRTMIKSSRGCCGEDELAEVKEAFEYGYFGLAYKTNEFEGEIGRYLDTDRYVITTSTGTNALHLALDTIGIKAGDEVIMPSFTFVATAQAVAMCGGTPVFCEVHPDTFLMDVEDVKKRITPRTKAIIPVHYAGRPCDMDALMKIKEETGIRIVEDAAHAFGTYYKGKKIGSFGDVTCFSFDSIKVMTCGEGGAVITDDPTFDDLSRKKRLLGIDRKTMHVKDWKKRSWIYDVPTLGYRYHMSNINAAIGLAQIKKVDQFIARRRELCRLYDSGLKDVEGVSIMPDDYDTITPFMYAVRVKEGKRNGLKDYLMEHDIESGISYIPCHHFSLFHNDNDSLPITDKIFDEVLCLPMHYELSDNDVNEVVAAVKVFLD